MSVQIESDPIPPSNVKFTVTISADLNAETPKKTYHRPQPSSSSSSPHKIPRIINNAPSPIIPEDSRTIHNEIVDSSSSSSLSSSASAIAYPYSSMKSSTYPKYPTSTTGYYQSPKIHRSPYGVRKPPFRNQTLILKPGTTEATSDSKSVKPTASPATVPTPTPPTATPAGVFRSRNKNMVYIPPRPS